MKKHIKSRIDNHPNFYKKPKCWGTASMGERGQIVVPAKARECLKLKKGEKLLVFSKGDKFLGILKFDEVSDNLKKWLSKIEGYKK